jgi:nicotinamidase-related amidase
MMTSDVLVMIDVVSRFDHDDGRTLLASFRARLRSMRAALDDARRAGTPVLYVNDRNGRWDGDTSGLLDDALAGPGADVVRTLAPQPDEAFLLKPRYSIFDHTMTEVLLGELESERLLLAGATTEGCVVQSGIDARELGYKVTILAGACATIDERLERVALRYAEDVAGIRVG